MGSEELTPGDLNRTLLLRQGLLERTSGDPMAMVGHLVGLQAQDRLPPYLSLAARLEDFDPRELSRALAERRAVRMVSLRGTVHLTTPEDALSIRGFTAPFLEGTRLSSPVTKDVGHLAPEETREAVAAVLADGPLSFKELGERLAERYDGLPANQLAHLARVDCPLVQVPPRGCWKSSGGLVLQQVDAWLGRPTEQADVPGLVRRYLAAFGPATAADVKTWSSVPGLGPVLEEMDLTTYRVGRTTYYDAPGAPLASAGTPAPVRLLGVYDDLWLSHAKKDRVTGPGTRKRWMGTNGGLAATIFVDGWLAGLWRVEDDRPVVRELFVELTRAQRSGLDEELERVAALLAVPADR